MKQRIFPLLMLFVLVSCNNENNSNNSYNSNQNPSIVTPSTSVITPISNNTSNFSTTQAKIKIEEPQLIDDASYEEYSEFPSELINKYMNVNIPQVTGKEYYAATYREKDDTSDTVVVSVNIYGDNIQTIYSNYKGQLEKIGFKVDYYSSDDFYFALNQTEYIAVQYSLATDDYEDKYFDLLVFRDVNDYEFIKSDVSKEGSYSLTIKDYATKNSWKDATKYNSVKFDEVTTLTLNNASINSGKYYTSDDSWRLYYSELTQIVIKSSLTIKSIKFTYSNTKNGILVFNETKYASNKTITLNSKTATIDLSGDAENATLKITAITIEY